MGNETVGSSTGTLYAYLGCKCWVGRVKIIELQNTVIHQISHWSLSVRTVDWYI